MFESLEARRLLAAAPVTTSEAVITPVNEPAVQVPATTDKGDSTSSRGDGGNHHGDHHTHHHGHH